MDQNSNDRLRRILAIDCATCVASGIVMIAGAAILAPVTGLPTELTRVAGLTLLPVAALFGVMATMRLIRRPLVLLAVLGNAAWVIASLAVLFVVPVTTTGIVFVAVQAAVVAILATLEWGAITHFRRAAV